MQVLAVIVVAEWSFSAVTNDATTANDRWPAVILSAVIVYLYIRRLTRLLTRLFVY